MRLISRTSLVPAAVITFLIGGSVAAVSEVHAAESAALSHTRSEVHAAESAAPSHTRSNDAPRDRQGLSFDDRLAVIAKDVPEFGGFYLDQEASSIYVFTTDVADETAREIRDHVAAQLDRPEIRDFIAVPLKGTYRWKQLWEWRRSARPVVLDDPGVVSLDIDDTANRLAIGINGDAGGQAFAATSERVRTLMDALDIPPAAVLVIPESPVRFESSLRDFHRPILGGLQIENEDFWMCSLGFIAQRSGVPGFVTNSHCTVTQGGVEDTLFGQPLAEAVVGQETVDPRYWTGPGCPATRLCRFSDAAFADIVNVTAFDQGHIAQPEAVLLDAAAWDGISTYVIQGDSDSAVGELVHKVGRTTGDTEGVVEDMCADFNALNPDGSDTGLTMLCQADATYASSGGDSGGSVFHVTSGDSVILRGIHWGGGGVFSNIDRVEDELGTLDTCVSSPCS